MDPQVVNERLSQIVTLWTLVCRAKEGVSDDVRQAQKKLLELYGGAIRRYLIGALRDADAAEELFQEFAYSLLHGDLKGASPDRGKFRGFVKGVLFHLIADHRKKEQRRHKQLTPDHPEPAVEAQTLEESERAFTSSWRDELLARAWAGLEAGEKETGKPFYTVLRFRAENPKMASEQMASALGSRLGKEITSAGVRQLLHRARERFADRLLDEVANSLSSPTAEELEDELIDLGLLDHCRPAMERREKNG